MHVLKIVWKKMPLYSLASRIPGFKNEEIRLLSSSETKMSMWKEYEGTCKTSNEKAVSYRKFLQLWDEFYPDVAVAKPMTDLCLKLVNKTPQNYSELPTSRMKKIRVCKGSPGTLEHCAN